MKTQEQMFFLHGEKIVYNVTKKTMKNIRIAVDLDGNIKVSAPVSAKKELIESLIIKEYEWIKNKIKESKIRKEYGDILNRGYIYIRGKKYTIIEQNGKNSIFIQEDKLYLTVKEDNEDYRKSILKKWLREHAREVYYEKVRKYSKITGKIPENVFIKEQKRAWGSCSVLGNINLNWRLIMAPDEIIDYVIIHELCHMIHMNHSAEYWKLVESILPDYKLRRKWLKTNGKNLDF